MLVTVSLVEDEISLRICPSYRTVLLGFSKLLGKLVIKYISTYTKGTLKKYKKKQTKKKQKKQKKPRSVKVLSNNAYVMFFSFRFFNEKHMMWLLI